MVLKTELDEDADVDPFPLFLLDRERALRMLVVRDPSSSLQSRFGQGRAHRH